MNDQSSLTMANNIFYDGYGIKDLNTCNYTNYNYESKGGNLHRPSTGKSDGHFWDCFPLWSPA